MSCGTLQTSHESWEISCYLVTDAAYGVLKSIKFEASLEVLFADMYSTNPVIVIVFPPNAPQAEILHLKARKLFLNRCPSETFKLLNIETSDSRINQNCLN